MKTFKQHSLFIWKKSVFHFQWINSGSVKKKKKKNQAP